MKREGLGGRVQERTQVCCVCVYLYVSVGGGEGK